MDSRTSSLRIRHHSSCSRYDAYVDSVFRSIDPLVHQYNMTGVRLHNEDVTDRPLEYNFDAFIRCTNLRYVTASDPFSISITTSSITSISTLYHILIKFSPVLFISLIPSIILPDPNSRVLSFSVIPPSNTTWIYFDSVANYFVEILFTQEYITLQHLIYESNLFKFSIATTISPNASIFFPSTYHFYLLHFSPAADHMGEYRTQYRKQIDSSSLSWDLISIDE